MAKLTEPVKSQISVTGTSGAKTLVKQARVGDIEYCQPFVGLNIPVNPRSAPATGAKVTGTKVANGHLGEIMVDDKAVGGSSEEISTASTEIVCIRSTHRNQTTNKRDLRIRSVSADRILEEDIKFTRVAIDIEDHCQEVKSGGGKPYSRKIIRQISDKSFLSWQDSETSCPDSLSTRPESPSTRQESISIRLGSLSNKQDSFSTRQGSVPSRPDSSASQGVSPMFGATQNTRQGEPVRRYWGRPRSYTAFGGHSWAGGDICKSTENIERLSQNR